MSLQTIILKLVGRYLVPITKWLARGLPSLDKPTVPTKPYTVDQRINPLIWNATKTRYLDSFQTPDGQSTLNACLEVTRSEQMFTTLMTEIMKNHGPELALNVVIGNAVYMGMCLERQINGSN